MAGKNESTVITTLNTPLVAGLEYLSGLDAGWGYLFIVGMGSPLDSSGLTTTASPG